MKATFDFRGARFVVTFDDEGIADTITRNGELISAAHRDARAILRHADMLRVGGLPEGFTRPGEKR